MRFRRKLLALILSMSVVMTTIGGLETTDSVQAATRSVTVATQKELDKALKKKGSVKITIKAPTKTSIKIKSGSYTNKQLVIKGAKLTITNSGKFKNIEIVDAKTYKENASNNSIKISDKKLGFVVGKKIEPASVNVSAEKADISFSGTTSKVMPVTISGNFSKITSSIAMKANVKASATITLNKGAEKSSIVKQVNVTAKVLNKTKETISVKRADGTIAKNLKAGTSVVDLSKSLKEAIELGVIDKTTAKKVDSYCNRKELMQMLNKVHKLRYQKTSNFLKDIETLSPKLDVNRMLFAVAVFYSTLEEYIDGTYTTAPKWIHYCRERLEVVPSDVADAVLIGPREDGTIGETGFWSYCKDVDDVYDSIIPVMESWDIDFGASANYVLCVPDLYTGQKLIDAKDTKLFQPDKKLTMSDAAELVVRYYNCIEPPAQMVAYSDVKDYDHSIITDKLLNKKTTLPDASCAKLPTEWKGILIGDLAYVNFGWLSGEADKVTTEADLDIIKEAGFNYIGYMVDFSYLQGPRTQPGMLNEERLKNLDRIIAECMKRDIHVDLRCSGVGGLSAFDNKDWFQYNHETQNDLSYANEFASIWGAVARRYQNIPNKYLSFNLLVEPEINEEETYAAFFTPAVNAIRESTPDRCIVADIHSEGPTGESMAKLGVALSYHLYNPRSFCVLEDENKITDKEYLESVTWPYEGVDGKSAMAMPMFGNSGISPLDMLATAKKYGVGMVIGEFGIFGSLPGILNEYRYTDETIENYLTDMTNVFAEYDIPWCYAGFSGSNGNQ